MVKSSVKRERKIEKELLWIIGFFAFLIILFISARAFFTHLNQVEYEGLVFTKEKHGDITFYHYAYSFKAGKDKILTYNLYIRTPPAENTVPVEGKIWFRGAKAFLAINASSLTQCDKVLLAEGALAQFLADNQFNLKVGSIDKEEAKELGLAHVSCEKYEGLNVIELFAGANETKITSQDGCIKIAIGPQCNVLEAVEKFQVQSILDSQEIHKSFSIAQNNQS